MGCSREADANPRIWHETLLPIRTVGKLFTGNITVVRQRRKPSAGAIVREKLTLGSEKLFLSGSYGIA